jgi:hypothetical protein
MKTCFLRGMHAIESMYISFIYESVYYLDIQECMHTQSKYSLLFGYLLVVIWIFFRACVPCISVSLYVFFCEQQSLFSYC